MSDEYLSKEEIKKWRSSVEKITLEEYAARLGKKLQEEKKTNDLADMLYTHFNPRQSFDNYNTITKLEKIDLTPKTTTTKSKIQVKREADDYLDKNEEINENLVAEETSTTAKAKAKKETSSETDTKKLIKSEAATDTVIDEVKDKSTKTKNKSDKQASETKEDKKDKSKTEKATKEKKSAKKDKSEDTKSFDFSSLNITFSKSLTDREEKVLAYFMEKRGEIVYAKDLAVLLDLKRDYIYKYIKNLRGKMSTDIIVNADNGGFKLE